MEESKSAEQALLKDLAGITVGDYDGEIDSILEYGYAFGLHYGKYIGVLMCITIVGIPFGVTAL